MAFHCVALFSLRHVAPHFGFSIVLATLHHVAPHFGVSITAGVLASPLRRDLWQMVPVPSTYSPQVQL